MSTLYDGSWWLTRSRKRGIGVFLTAYYTKFAPHASENQIWFFPRPLSTEEKQSFFTTFGRKEIIECPTDSAHDLRQTLRTTIKQQHITHVSIGSPFEQPWSLLQLWPDLRRRKIHTSVIIHDLIPLRYRKEIFQRWSLIEQSSYQRLIDYIKEVSQIICTSSFSFAEAQQLLNAKKSQLKKLSFGETTAWIVPPKSEPPISALQNDKKIALTISGGDWRKNLAGTIEYYAQTLATSHELFVICKLSVQEHLYYRFLAWQRGVGTQVHFLGEIGEEAKWGYLHSADTFLFLSHAEGLGIPLLEAHKAGITKYVLSEELFSQGFARLLPKKAVVTSATFYDRYHFKNQGYTKIIRRNNFTYFYILEFLDKHFGNVRNKKILDVGCGVGTLALFWAKQGAHTTGIDVSPRAIQLAKAAAAATSLEKNAHFTCEYLSRGQHEFDLVSCTEVIEHVPNEAEFLQFLASQLKKGGALMLTTPSSMHWLYRVGFYKKFDKEVGHLRRYTPTQLKERISAAGFDVKEIRGVEGPIRSILFSTRLGELIRLIRGPLIPFFHFFDRLSVPLFGASGWQVWAVRK